MGCHAHHRDEDLREFAANNSSARASVEYWIRITKAARWFSSRDVLAAFATAKVINSERVRFELVHNNFRLVCRINYASGAVFIMFVGTHKEYDQIDVKTVSMF